MHDRAVRFARALPRFVAKGAIGGVSDLQVGRLVEVLPVFTEDMNVGSLRGQDKLPDFLERSDSHGLLVIADKSTEDGARAFELFCGGARKP